MANKVKFFGLSFESDWVGWIIISFLSIIGLKVLQLIGLILFIGFVMEQTGFNWFFSLAIIIFLWLLLANIFSNSN